MSESMPSDSTPVQNDTTASDDTTTVADLRAAVASFIAARDWQAYHTPKNLAMSIAIEAAEIMEHFQWYSLEESNGRVGNPAIHAEVADEVADVIIYCMSLANAAHIDLTSAILKKLARNETRFPVDRVRGKLG